MINKRQRRPTSSYPEKKKVSWATTDDVWRKWTPDKLPVGRFLRKCSLKKISYYTVLLFFCSLDPTQSRSIPSTQGGCCCSHCCFVVIVSAVLVHRFASNTDCSYCDVVCHRKLRKWNADQSVLIRLCQDNIVVLHRRHSCTMVAVSS